MTITSRIHQELFEPTHAPGSADGSGSTRLLVRMPLTRPRGAATEPAKDATRRQRRRHRPAADPKNLALAWSADEHERFLYGLELFPHGPWKDVAQLVGTRTVRQTMTHAQKYRQKIARHKRRLQADTVTISAAAASASTASMEMATPQMDVTAYFDSAAFYPSSTPRASAPAFQPIFSPSSADQLAFAVQMPPTESALWYGACSLASVDFPAPLPPLMLQQRNYSAAIDVNEPLVRAGSELDFLLDDAELNSLVLADLTSGAGTEYLAPFAMSSGVGGVSARRSIADQQ